MKLARFQTLFGIDLRSLALLRVGLGLVLLYDLSSRAQWLRAHYTDSGILSRGALLSDTSSDWWRWSLHLIGGDTFTEALLFAIAMVFAFGLLIGYRTRLVTIISWVLLISLQNRNPLILQGGDQLLRVLMFWAMFLPLGARYSIDASLDRSPPKDNPYYSAATFALLVQVMCLYFFTALLKSDPAWIPDGKAVAFALHIDHFATRAGVWLREFTTLTQGLTYFVWFLELLAPVIMFFPVWHVAARLLGLALLATLHLGFFIFLEIGFFPFVDWVALAAFVPSAVWDRLARWRDSPERLGLKIWYDRDCGFCEKTCWMLRVFLLLPPSIPVRPAQEDATAGRLLEAHYSWVVTDHDGEHYLKWRAVRLLVRRSPLFWPLDWLLALAPLRWAGDRLYVWIGAHRAMLGRVSARLFPVRPVTTQIHWLFSIIAYGVIAYILYWNVASLPYTKLPQPALFRQPLLLLRIDQLWNMFAPLPLREDGWYVIRGELVDGTAVDVYRGTEGEPAFTKPEHVADMYPYWRWRKYLMNLSRKSGYVAHRRNYGQYLCIVWNERRNPPPEKRLQKFVIYFMREYTPDTLQPGPPEKEVLWRHYCPLSRE